MSELRPLSPTECLTLLSGARFGRLVFTEGALPTIRPVNFFMNNGDIIVRTHRQSAIGRLRNEVVAFEVDDIDQYSHTGWSVVAVGKAEPVLDIDDIVTLAVPGHMPWAPGEHGHFVRIPVEIITGRRLALTPVPSA